MAKTQLPPGKKSEELLAELAEAAYRVTSRQGFKGAFIDIELDLWHALQAHGCRPFFHA